MASIPTLTTDRLKLRPLTANDATDLHRILCQDRVLQFFPRSDPPKLQGVEKLIRRQLNLWHEVGYSLWAVETKPDCAMIGWCGLQYLPETDEIEVAYLLDRDYWGHGLATESATASLRYGFDNLKIDEIVGIVHRYHSASQRVLEKIGMQNTGEAVYFGMDCYRYNIERLLIDPPSN